jgi:hypothetical protein
MYKIRTFSCRKKAEAVQGFFYKRTAGGEGNEKT